MSAASKTSETPTSFETRGDSDPPLVIVDASNVALDGRSGGAKARLSFLLEVVSQIPEPTCEVIVIADASLRHRIDDREEYEKLVNSGVILQAPAGRSADRFAALLARRRRSMGQLVYVLTNDLLRENPDLGSLRVTFLETRDGEVIFDPPLSDLAVPALSHRKDIRSDIDSGTVEIQHRVTSNTEERREDSTDNPTKVGPKGDRGVI